MASEEHAQNGLAAGGFSGEFLGLSGAAGSGLCATEEHAQNGLAAGGSWGEFLGLSGAAGSGLCATEEHAQNGLAAGGFSGEFLGLSGAAGSGLCATEEHAQNGLAASGFSGEFLGLSGAAGSGLCATEEHAQNGLAASGFSGEFLDLSGGAGSGLCAPRKSRSLSLSALAHVLALAVLLTFHSQIPLNTMPVVPALHPLKLVFLPPGNDHAGGANSARAPARKGAPPPRIARIFVPPQVQPEPKLPIPIGIDFDTPASVLADVPIGDPLGKLGLNSLGSGGHDGIGNFGCCGGVGDTQGTMTGSGGAGHRITPPQLIYKIEPEFSEEARKAKFQGTVILSVQVDASGNPSHLVVVSSPGLGLDEKAIEAVARWRFRPAFRDGKPFVTTARIEVSFHLL